jgi:hypothetical protein
VEFVAIDKFEKPTLDQAIRAYAASLGVVLRSE